MHSIEQCWKTCTNSSKQYNLLAIVEDTSLVHELGMNGMIGTPAKYVIKSACFQNKLLWKNESFDMLNKKQKQFLTFITPCLDRSLKKVTRHAHHHENTLFKENGYTISDHLFAHLQLFQKRNQFRLLMDHTHQLLLWKFVMYSASFSHHQSCVQCNHK